MNEATVLSAGFVRQFVRCKNFAFGAKFVRTCKLVR